MIPSELCQTIEEATAELAARRGMLHVALKFAKHKPDCHCFICRNLTDDERALLAEAHKYDWGDRA